jgi:hypothetical protein
MSYNYNKNTSKVDLDPQSQNTKKESNNISQNIPLMLFDLLLLPIHIIRIILIYFWGSKYNYKGLYFLDVIMHADKPYFNQEECNMIDTIGTDYRIIIRDDSRIFPSDLNNYFELKQIELIPKNLNSADGNIVSWSCKKKIPESNTNIIELKEKSEIQNKHLKELNSNNVVIGSTQWDNEPDNIIDTSLNTIIDTNIIDVVKKCDDGPNSDDLKNESYKEYDNDNDSYSDSNNESNSELNNESTDDLEKRSHYNLENISHDTNNENYFERNNNIKILVTKNKIELLDSIRNDLDSVLNHEK